MTFPKMRGMHIVQREATPIPAMAVPKVSFCRRRSLLSSCKETGAVWGGVDVMVLSLELDFLPSSSRRKSEGERRKERRAWACKGCLDCGFRILSGYV